MTENATVMQNFIQATPEPQGREKKSKYKKWLQRVATAHLVIGCISSLTEVIALVVWRESSIFELPIPGLVCGILCCALGALTIALGPDLNRNWMIALIVFLIISMFLDLGTLAVNVFMIGLLIIIAEKFIAQIIMNIIMIPCAVAGFVNCCFHFHCYRRLR